MTEIDQRRALFTVFGIVFVDLLGFGILIPVIPLYARSFGATEFTASLLIASYSLMQFVFAPVLGRLSDERGRRPILLLSLTGSVLAWTLFGVAEVFPPQILGPITPLWVLFLARMVAGAMGGNIATAQAYIADITPPEDRAKGLGLLGAAFGLGFVFGPAIGGVFSSDLMIDLVRTLPHGPIPVTEFSLPSFAAAGITGANLLLAAAVLPESRPPSERTVGDDLAGFRDRFERRIGDLYDAVTAEVLGTLIVAFFMASFAFSALESQFIFFTNDLFGYGTTANAVLLTYLGVVIAIVQGGLIGPLTERVGEYRLAITGAAIQFVTLAAFPFTPELGTVIPTVGRLVGVGPTLSSGAIALLVVLTVLSFGNAITNVSLNTLVSRGASADEQGGAFGLTQSAGSLARTVGPSSAGFLYTFLGYWVPFVVAGLVFLPVVVLLGSVDRTAVAATQGEDGSTDGDESETDDADPSVDD